MQPNRLYHGNVLLEAMIWVFMLQDFIHRLKSYNHLIQEQPTRKLKTFCGLSKGKFVNPTQFHLFGFFSSKFKLPKILRERNLIPRIYELLLAPQKATIAGLFPFCLTTCFSHLSLFLHNLIWISEEGHVFSDIYWPKRTTGWPWISVSHGKGSAAQKLSF